MIGDAGGEEDGPSGGPLRDPALAEALRTAVAQDGPALLYAPAVLRHRLEETCPRAGADTALLLIALDEQVPQALLGVYADGARDALTRRLADQLHARRGLDRRAARWAVDTWAQALRVGPSSAVPLAIDPADRDAVDEATASTTPTTRPFTAWRAVAGGVAILIVAAAMLGGMQLWSASRSDPARVLDALTTSAQGGAPEPAVPAPTSPAASTPIERPAVLQAEPTPSPTPPAAAEAARASSIVDIVVPPDLVAGRRFVLTIHYRVGDRPPVAIERRVVQVGTKPSNVVRNTPLAGLTGSEPGTLRYPVAGVSGAARRTYLFTLIDADGARSASTRVTVDIAAAAAPTCTRDTCGTVTAVRPVAQRFALTVRMDDRTVRTITHARRIHVGRRVRWSGGRLAEIASAPPARRTTK